MLFCKWRPGKTLSLSVCRRGVEEVDRNTDFVLTIGISRHHQNSLHLSVAASEADDAQQFTLYSSQPSVMRSEDLPKFSENTAKDLLERLRLVESALENRSRDAAAKNLEELFTCIRQKFPFPGCSRLAGCCTASAQVCF